MEAINGRKLWFLREIFYYVLFFCVSNILCGHIRYSITEEMDKGSLVGNITKDLGLDVKKLSAGKGRLVSENSKLYFQVNVNNGMLFVNDRIDREELCGQIQPCTLQFEVVVENPLELYRVEVEIQDINDNSPSFAKNELLLKIHELTSPGAGFPLESAHDLDVGSNALQNYQISKNDCFNLEVRTRSDGNKYAELVLEKSLDRETESEYNLILTAVDGGNPQRSGTAKVHIIILDANDIAPAFNQDIYKADLLENSLKEQIVVTVNAKDLDEGSNGKITYSFSQVTDKIKQVFKINSFTGEIKVADMMDYEEVKAYEIDVKATDGGGLSSHCKVLIEIIDVNDNAPELTMTSVSSPLPEDSLPGTVVALFSVKDQDSGENGEVLCSIQEHLPFYLKSSFKYYYELVTSEQLDRERVSHYNITITATDCGSPPLSTLETIHIQIADTNDNPPVFNQTFYNLYVTENNRQSSPLGSVKAFDSDSEENSRISYSIEKQSNGSSFFPFISVNTYSGIIHASHSFDYEQFTSFQVLIKAQDSGSPPLSSIVTVNVIIVDENDNTPRILYPLQNSSSSTTDLVSRTAETGCLVTKVVAVDADSGQNAWLSYHLLKATDPGLFYVGINNGEIRTVRLIVDQDSIRQRLVIIVKDNGEPSLSSTVTLTLLLIESFSNFQLDYMNMHTENEQDTRLTRYLIISLSLVSFIFLVSLVILTFVRFRRYKNSSCLFSTTDINFHTTPHVSFPSNCLDSGTNGTVPHDYCYEVCLATATTKREYNFFKPIISPDTKGWNKTQDCDPEKTKVSVTNVSDRNDAIRQVTSKFTDDSSLINKSVLVKQEHQQSYVIASNNKLINK
nr:PREDICTED: protocadherin beta-16-like [Latimeria chalumnae]|eukprot:XP_005995421.1 PREDICTED: protocadherin beta-16-like [Latimeria chalumnae]